MLISLRRDRYDWLAFLVAALIVIPVIASSPLWAGPSDDTIIAGAQVYNGSCAMCHQPGGVGRPGRYPPLLNNPRIGDTAYVSEVIRNGVSGPLDVDGETYDSVMGPQPGLTDIEIDQVIAYMQAGFPDPDALTEPPAHTAAPTPAPSTSVEPASSRPLGLIVVIGFAVILVGVAFSVWRPRRGALDDARQVTWGDASVVSVAIVAITIVVTIGLPTAVVKLGGQLGWSSGLQDGLAVVVWLAGLVVLMVTLAKRGSRS